MGVSFRSIALAVIAILFVQATPASANHSWGPYHWAREANPFTLKLGDNLTAAWDPYLVQASTDWSRSNVLDTTIVAGTVGNVKRCNAATGRVEVCNASYGNNGWLGIAGISVSGGHITAGYVKLNDYYFNTSTYNKPEWKQMVACQEVAHAFGLDHQDETQGNTNLGSCMDYTNNPLGPPSNVGPNQHDYDQIQTIYSHLDSTTTINATKASNPQAGRRSRIDSVDDHGNGTVTWIHWVP